MMREIRIRGLPPTGELEELRQRLLQEVVIEDKLKLHLYKLKHCNALEACMIALLHKIPCILHCENWVGIKFLTILLIEGFINAQRGTKFWEMTMAHHSGTFQWMKMEEMWG
jgi:hypothetical protein